MTREHAANPMHLAQPAGTHPPAPEGPPVTDDLTRQVLAAIDGAEEQARADLDHFGGTDNPRDRYICELANVVLRHCAADRRLVDEFLEVDRVMKNAAEFELTNASVSGFRNGLPRGVYSACDRYGITQETRVDLSAGSSPADLQRVAAEHGVEATFTWEGYFPRRR